METHTSFLYIYIYCLYVHLFDLFDLLICLSIGNAVARRRAAPRRARAWRRAAAPLRSGCCVRKEDLPGVVRKEDLLVVFAKKVFGDSLRNNICVT